jgi:hypothetical protein
MSQLNLVVHFIRSHKYIVAYDNFVAIAHSKLIKYASKLRENKHEHWMVYLANIAI